MLSRHMEDTIIIILNSELRPHRNWKLYAYYAPVCNMEIFQTYNQNCTEQAVGELVPVDDFFFKNESQP